MASPCCPLCGQALDLAPRLIELETAFIDAMKGPSMLYSWRCRELALLRDDILAARDVEKPT